MVHRLVGVLVRARSTSGRASGSPPRIVLLPSTVQPFGVLLAAGVGLGLLVCDRLARAAGLDRNLGGMAFVTGAVAALAGARGVYVAGSPERETLLEVLALGRGGLSGYGALGAGSAAFAWAVSRGRDSVWSWLDVAAPGMLLCAALARLGCLLTGCDFGVPAREGVLARFGVFASAGPVHPTQLYEASLLLAVCALSLFARRVQRANGQLFVGCAVAYAVVRFSLEPLRGDGDRGVLGVLTLTQWCALGSVAAVLGAWLRTRQRLTSST